MEKIKLLKLKNVGNVVFHLNPAKIVSFAMATKNDGEDKKGCAWVAAGNQQYFLDLPSTAKLKEHLILEEADEADEAPAVLAEVKPIATLKAVADEETSEP